LKCVKTVEILSKLYGFEDNSGYIDDAFGPPIKFDILNLECVGAPYHCLHNHCQENEDASLHAQLMLTLIILSLILGVHFEQNKLHFENEIVEDDPS
jgi:hypothetical protein